MRVTLNRVRRIKAAVVERLPDSELEPLTKRELADVVDFIEDQYAEE